MKICQQCQAENDDARQQCYKCQAALLAQDDELALIPKPAEDITRTAPELPPALARNQQTLALLESLKNVPPDQLEKIVSSMEKIMRATQPEMARLALRKQGMQGLLALSALSVIGSVIALLMSGALAWPPIALALLAIICAGAAAALGSGQAVKLSEFSEMVEKVAEVIYSLTGAGRAHHDEGDKQ